MSDYVVIYEQAEDGTWRRLRCLKRGQAFSVEAAAGSVSFAREPGPGRARFSSGQVPTLTEAIGSAWGFSPSVQ
jgi:hypothetical protein